MIRVMSQLHRQNLSLKGNVTAKATDNAEHPNSSHLNRKATDTTPPAPVVTSDLGKATTTDPVEVTTDPNTKVNY